MQEVPARAALAAAPGPDGGVTTSLARDEVEEALRSAAQETPQLILDLTRFEDGEVAETRRIAVAWEKGDLEELLRQTSGERVVLTFDRTALEQAMVADVEAHGFREKILILAVAATAAGGAAGAAAAHPVGVPAGGGEAVEAVVSPDDRGLSMASPVAAADTAVSPDDRAASRAFPVAAPDTGVSPDDRAVSRMAPVAADDTALGPDDRAVSRAFPAPETGVGADDRAVSRAAPVSVADEATGLSPDDRPLSRAATSPGPSVEGTGSEGGLSISAPSPTETAAIGGAIALAITGAAFLVAGRRHGRPA